MFASNWRTLEGTKDSSFQELKDQLKGDEALVIHILPMIPYDGGIFWRVRSEEEFKKTFSTYWADWLKGSEVTYWAV